MSTQSVHCRNRVTLAHGVSASGRPAIVAALNPAADSEVESMLGRLRAAHSGALPAILKAIEEGCRATLADNAEASGFDALSLATRNSQWTSSAKW